MSVRISASPCAVNLIVDAINVRSRDIGTSTCHNIVIRYQEHPDSNVLHLTLWPAKRGKGYSTSTRQA